MAVGIDDEGLGSSFVQVTPGAFSELWNGTAWVAQPLAQPPSLLRRAQDAGDGLGAVG
jgi:hypothetical protein